MKKKVEIPLSEPMFSAYHYIGALGASIAKNPSVRNWYLNESINLLCNKRFLSGFTTPELKVDMTWLDRFPCFEWDAYWFSVYSPGIRVMVRDMLDHGYLVEFTNVDDYYVKGKSWYHEKHFAHDGLICGYDQTDRTFSIFSYDKNWVYRVFKTPQRAWDKGLKSAFNLGAICCIRAIKVKDDPIVFDPSRVYMNIKNYLTSTVEDNLASKDEDCSGVAVHDFLNMYLKRLEIGSIPLERMDSRIFRLLWEHKKAMLERIQAVERELSFDDTISYRYMSVVQTADRTRMLYSMLHRGRRASILPTIRKNLMDMKKQEITLLKQLLKKMKPHM